MGSFNGWVNPLKFLELELPNRTGGVPTAEQVLSYLSSSRTGEGVAGFTSRFSEITLIPDPIPIVGAEAVLLEKLVWPLRHARGSYGLGNFVGCIALCGFVCEMAAVLLWEISDHGRGVSKAKQKRLFGKAFEDLGQSRRIDVLRGCGMLPGNSAKPFETVRRKRNVYLHNLSQSYSGAATDAIECLRATMEVVGEVLGPDIMNGRTRFRKELMRYLIEKGVASLDELESSEDTDSEEA